MRSTLVLLMIAALPSCSWFEDRTPRNVFLRVSGEPGTELRLVLSTQFLAGVNEEGVTRVQLVRSDTLVRTPPLDTVIAVHVDRRFFVEITPREEETPELHVDVEVDGRGLYDSRGLVFAAEPFRFVYLFNEPYTRLIEVL